MLKINESVGLDKYTDAMYFNTDDDFYTFCVHPVIVAREYTTNTGSVSQYADFDFTNAYEEAVKNNVAFVIRDKNSQILKHNGVVSYRTISKQTKNLKPWFYETIFTKKFKSE